jgi:hypothetical protein
MPVRMQWVDSCDRSDEEAKEKICSAEKDRKFSTENAMSMLSLDGSLSGYCSRAAPDNLAAHRHKRQRPSFSQMPAPNRVKPHK